MATVALPAIARALEAQMSVLQWIAGAPLLGMTALLPAGGVLGDRLGRRRASATGLVLFAAGAAAAAVAPTATWLIGARLAQGVAAALILPSAVAIIRSRVGHQPERTRIFGVWAAGTGLSAALGPLVGGALVDAMGWRAVFGLTAILAVPAVVAMAVVAEVPAAAGPRHATLLDMFCLSALLGAVAYILIEGPGGGWSSRSVSAAAGVLGGAGLALFCRRRHGMLSAAEVCSSGNCMTANAATFLLYFGMFGFSFLIGIYIQVELGYAAIWAGVALVPLSAMLLLAERFGRVTSGRHVRILVTGGPLAAGAAILWIAFGPHPLPFWSHIFPGAALFGLGLAMTVSPLTEAAVASVPDLCAGAASGIHHMTVRMAGLIAVAMLGSLAVGSDGSLISLDGFRAALTTCGILAAVAGPVAANLVRDPGGALLPGEGSA
jgi:MFS family permease